MKNKISKELKRYNYLFGETGAVYHEMYMKLGLSDSAMLVLYTVLENGGSCMLQDVCRFTGLAKQTINSAVRRLEADGVVYLETAGSKNKMIYLTREGQDLAENTAGRVIMAEDEVFASWSQKDVEKYLELTERFMKDLKEKAENM